MHGATNRKLIVAVLLIACSIVSILLLRQQSGNTKQLIGLNKADSLIVTACNSFNISKSAYHVETIPVTPHFKRKIWHISLPVNLSQTFFHYDISQLFDPYNIQTPAKVNLKDGTMDIELYYKDTVIRTIALHNDTNSVRYDMPASIVLFFNQRPNEKITDQIRSLGEPVLIAFKTDRVVQTDSWLHVPGIEDFNIAYWIEPSSSPDQDSEDRWYRGEQIRNLAKMIHHPQILVGPDNSNDQLKQWTDICKTHGFRMIDATDALWISQDTSTHSLVNIIRRFYKQASLGHHPILMMAADQVNLSELKHTIPAYRKRGLVILPPSRNVR